MHGWLIHRKQRLSNGWGLRFQEFEIAPAWFIRPFNEPFYLLTPPSTVQPKKHPRTENVSGPSILMGDGVWDSKKKAKIQALNVWYTYLHLLIFNGKCWNIYHIHYISVWEDNHWTTHTHTPPWGGKNVVPKLFTRQISTNLTRGVNMVTQPAF